MTQQMPFPPRAIVRAAVDAEPMAQESKINLSLANDAALRQVVDVADTDRWLADNAAALDSSNAYVDRLGLPLARFRRF
ncbi:MAG TPA: type II toxin-antitoxin system CcdA family antitoxin [Burkholderiaceae bacterium]|nr:type II toxin-antitoxin system CcdA family antitoxin [Burkholderiaceae bacterium]HNB45293.1 type II toxin-antitoxin system CcdA family antitoxin [Burkholderiaceae bacterium]HNG80931.1 type II toxin-antitoxin system CcdA family antitoxin [Burkholderiaceae bacterium]